MAAVAAFSVPTGIQVFSSRSNSWESWLERLNLVLDLHDVVDPIKRRQILLTNLDTDEYEKL